MHRMTESRPGHFDSATYPNADHLPCDELQRLQKRSQIKLIFEGSVLIPDDYRGFAFRPG
jgi:hypothetical protein